MTRSQNIPGFSTSFHPDEFPLGMAYVPLQESINMYENLEKDPKILAQERYERFRKF